MHAIKTAFTSATGTVAGYCRQTLGPDCQRPGHGRPAAREMLNMTVPGQSPLLAANGMMMAIAVVFFVAAFAIVLALKAANAVDTAYFGY